MRNEMRSIEENIVRNIIYFELHEKLYYSKIKVEDETFKKFITGLYDEYTSPLLDSPNRAELRKQCSIKINKFVKEQKNMI